MEQEIKDGLEAIKTQVSDQANKFVSKEAHDEALRNFETAKSEQLKEIESLKETNSAKAKELEEAVKTMEDMVKELSKKPAKDMDALNVMATEFKEAFTATKFTGEGNAKQKIALKANNPLTHTFTDIVDGAGNTIISGVDETTGTWFSQLIGQPVTNNRSDLSWIQRLNPVPLEAGSISVLELCNENGSAECIDECEVKPYVNLKPELKTKNAKAIAAMFKFSNLWTKQFGRLQNSLISAFRELVFEKLHEVIVSEIIAGSSTFTNVSGYDYDALDSVEAINAAITEMESAQYSNISAVYLNQRDYFSFGKIVDGNGRPKYKCCDGEGAALFMGLPVVLSPFVPAGTIGLVDESAINYAVESGVVLRSNVSGDDFETNCYTNRLETYFALLIPDCSSKHVVFDTIANIKTKVG